MLNQDCEVCQRERNVEVKKFKLEFDADKLSPNSRGIVEETQGVFCVFENCDDEFGFLIENNNDR